MQVLRMNLVETAAKLLLKCDENRVDRCGMESSYTFFKRNSILG